MRFLRFFNGSTQSSEIVADLLRHMIVIHLKFVLNVLQGACESGIDIKTE